MCTTSGRTCSSQAAKAWAAPGLSKLSGSLQAVHGVVTSQVTSTPWPSACVQVSRGVRESSRYPA